MASAEIPRKQTMGNKKVEEKGGCRGRKEHKNGRKQKYKRESEVKIWVLNNKMLLQHCIW